MKVAVAACSLRTNDKIHVLTCIYNLSCSLREICIICTCDVGDITRMSYVHLMRDLKVPDIENIVRSIIWCTVM